MTRIAVTGGVGDLARDLEAMPAKLARKAPRVVRRAAVEGNRLARGLAKERSGPHGANYFKRLSAEMTGPTKAEFGPEGIPKSEFVGTGFRHGVNTDLLDAADVIGPKFAKDVGDMVEDLFW